MTTLSSTDEFHKKSALDHPMKKQSIESSTFLSVCIGKRPSPVQAVLFSLWLCAVQLPRTQSQNIF